MPHDGFSEVYLLVFNRLVEFWIGRIVAGIPFAEEVAESADFGVGDRQVAEVYGEAIV
jgi:hypothetical protein